MWGGWFRCRQDTDSHICDQRFNHSGGDACLGTLTCFSSEGSASKDKCITVFPKNERTSGSIRQDNFWEVEAWRSLDLILQGAVCLVATHQVGLLWVRAVPPFKCILNFKKGITQGVANFKETLKSLK